MSLNVKVKDILKKEYWKNATNFQSFYNKEIVYVAEDYRRLQDYRNCKIFNVCWDIMR